MRLNDDENFFQIILIRDKKMRLYAFWNNSYVHFKKKNNNNKL